MSQLAMGTEPPTATGTTYCISHLALHIVPQTATGTISQLVTLYHKQLEALYHS